jgi:methylmalonyl-CoA mutase
MTDGGDLFSAATQEQWTELVRAKAQDPDAPLITELEDGLSVKWLYTDADALPTDPTTRGPRAGTPWAIRQQVQARTRSLANAQILDELEGGAGEILLTLDRSGVRGIPALTAAEIEEVLGGVYLNMAAVALDSGALTAHEQRAAAEALISVFGASGHDAAELRGSLGLASADQLGFAAAATDRFPHVRGIAVDTGRYVDAGAGVRDELAYALATGAHLLRAGEEAGLSPVQTARTIEFTLIAGTDQFLEIAKFRAARKLWATVLEHCGVSAEIAGTAPNSLSGFYARTGRRVMSSLDPWVNMLRSTTAAFAAGVGGADGVTVVPFDEPDGETLAEPGALGRRTARNTQLLLLEESHLHKVNDPAGGSWYVESLTEQLAGSAWARFQEFEAQGGITALAASGAIDDQIAAATAKRHLAIATRERELTGVNTFPLLGDDELRRESSTSTDVSSDRGPSAPTVVRDAAEFEHLRLRAAAISDPPRLLLACMGPLSAHVAINLWAKSFFEAGGVETISSGPQPDAAALARLLSEHELSVAAVCPGRGVEADAQTELITALRDAGAERIYLVGAGDDAAVAAGADAGAQSGMNMVTVLGALLDHYETGAEAAR